MSFNFGAEPVVAGGSIVQAKEGDHSARVAGILHLGVYSDVFHGKGGAKEVKSPAPFVCILFELKDEEDVDEEGNPIVVHLSIPLKKNDKSNLTKFMQAVLSTEDFKLYLAGVLTGGFEDIIGRPVNVHMKGSKALNDDGTPKYTNVSNVTSMHHKLAALTEPLTKSIGHVPLDAYTPDAMRAVPPFEIYGKMEKAVNFPGSKAESVLSEIRKDKPEFAKPPSSDGSDATQEAAAPVQQREDLDEDQEF